jgi:TonB-dependent receptor-like protein
MKSTSFRLVLAAAVSMILLPVLIAAQELTGSLIGTVKDSQGGVLQNAVARVSSPALIGGPITLKTNEKGQLRFPVLPPGLYALDVELEGFAPWHETAIPIGVNTTIERTVMLNLAGVAESVVVEGSRIDARNPGFASRLGFEDLRTIPSRRTSMFDAIRAMPGISPTSPASGTVTTISAFGSGTNENQFLIDGTNFTCPCTGIARAEPGIDFIQEVQVQSVGASAEFGNVQGAVINVVTRQGSERWQSDSSYYWQNAALTSQPVMLPSAGGPSGYERARYRDLTANLGGPAIHDRLWFFAGYQYLRDADSQPGADPAFPRIYEQNKVFAKLTWNLAPAWRLNQSLHGEHWISADPPTVTTPYAATVQRRTNVPAITFGELTHTVSPSTLWDVRAARFVFSQKSLPPSGDLTTPNHSDVATGINSGAPPLLGSPTIARTTVKTTLSRYMAGWAGADHQLKVGAQFEQGGHHAVNLIPTGVRYVDSAGQPSQRISRAAYNAGAMFNSAAAFASDAMTLGDRLTVSAGLRFDHTRAISQDLHAVDVQGRETSDIVHGLGTLYTWNIVSPRVGATAKLSADGRTMLRASYGRFSQGVLTGELEQFHPGATSTTMANYDPATGDYTQNIVVLKPSTNLILDREMRAPRTDEYSLSVDRELRSELATAVAYIHKEGGNIIGWTDTAGQYQPSTRTLRDGRVVPVFELVNAPSARRFLLTNVDGYSMTYNGLVFAAEKRRSHGWQAFGSYTLSKVEGLLPSSGAAVSGAQVSSIGGGQPLTFGQDPNTLTNARGRLLGDRPHIVRVATSVDLPKTGMSLAANFQYFSGKPWAASALVPLPQNDKQRVLIETPGTRRLSSQSLLDLRVSRTFVFKNVGRVDVLLDVLNALNDTAEETIATDNFFGSTFRQPTIFMDPRRAMIGVRLNLGQ